VKKIIYPLIWLAVTMAAVLIASAAVSSVRDQVTDTPAAMLTPTATAPGSTERQVPDSTRVGTSPPTSADEPATSTTTIPSTTTTIPAEPVATSVPTTTAPSFPDPTTTTTTTTTITTSTTPPITAPATELRSYELVGGLISVEIGDEVVRLAGASPKPGFTMEVENSGPEKVEVEFHNGDHESHFSGKFEDGRFVPSISEGDEEDDD
jgi:hypothetical protein